MDIQVNNGKTPNQTNSLKSNSSRSRKSGKPWVIGILVLLSLATTGTAGFFYYKFREIQDNPQQVTIDETKAIVEKVGKLITLPTKEQPTLATVLDKKELKDQAFFNDAKDGDKILIYTEAKKAIIYREATDKIINVGPILLQSDTKEPVKN